MDDLISNAVPLKGGDEALLSALMDSLKAASRLQARVENWLAIIVILIIIRLEPNCG
jgi:hypothetical protein